MFAWLKRLFSKSPGRPASDGLHGTWVVTEAEVDGQARADLVGQQIVMRGGWLNFGPNYPMSDGGYSDEPAQRPCHLTLDRHNPQFVPPFVTIAFAPMDFPGAAANVAMVTTTHLAIYELAGGTLKICGMGKDGRRPKTFATQPGTGQYLVICERQ
jgi:uncharacterized protein (TIGR03067 family)